MLFQKEQRGILFTLRQISILGLKTGLLIGLVVYAWLRNGGSSAPSSNYNDQVVPVATVVVDEMLRKNSFSSHKQPIVDEQPILQFSTGNVATLSGHCFMQTDDLDPSNPSSNPIGSELGALVF